MRLLAFTQGYPPDPMSVGQYFADVAAEFAQRGHSVTVLSSDRGYDDPSIRYPSREARDGVDVVRLPFSSAGKGSFGRRAIAAAWYQAQCALSGIMDRGLDAILTSTVPPLAGVSALLPSTLRGVPFAYWVMDLNPEQLVVLGMLKANAAATRVLEGVNRMLLRRARLVIALDRFMEARLRAKVPLDERLTVIPPWPHEHVLEPIPHESNPFRTEQGLDGKFVFMFSGNHGLSNPLATFLEATLAFRDDPEVVFLFVGGGQRKSEVVEFIARHGLSNVRSLPYQPLDQIRYSLSAADAHFVALGDPFVGIVHPSKTYGAMAVGRPLVYLGPEPSHIADLLARYRIGWRIPQGDVPDAVRVLREVRATPASEREAMGARALAALATDLGQRQLCGQVCDRIEAMVAGAHPARRSGVTEPEVRA